MRILCIDQYADLGGAQRMLLELLPALVARGWSAELTLPGTGTFSEAAVKAGYVTHSFKAGTYAKVRKTAPEMIRYAFEWPRVVRQLGQLVEERRLDILYVNGPRILPAAAYLARTKGLPLIFHCHNRLQQKTAIELAGRSLMWARARVIACCEFALAPLEAYVEGKRMQVIYNGVSPVDVALSYATKPITKIGVIGRIEEEKGQLDFVEAARMLHGLRPELDFVIIGAPLFSNRSYLTRVRRAAAGLPLHFVPWQENVADAFASIDLLIVPSSSLDATPRVILEGLAFGVPVVAFAVGGIPEILRDGETGFLVENRTAAALAQRILSVLCLRDDEIARVKTHGLEVCREEFNLQRFQDGIARVLEETREAA